MELGPKASRFCSLLPPGGFFKYCLRGFLTCPSKERELKSVLMKVKEESGKTGLKLNIQKTKIMASDPITSWQIDGETMETVTDFIFLGSKITADGDCSHEIKRCLLLGGKVMTNLDSILWRRKWQLTPVLLPGKSHGRRSLVGYSP